MNDETPEAPQHFQVIAALFEGALVVVAVGLGWLLGQPPLATFRFTWAGLGWGALATLPPLGVLLVSVRTPWGPLEELTRVVDRLLVPLFRDWRIVQFAGLAVLAGLGEEMLFRGVIQGAVAEAVGGPVGVGVGLAVAAVLFGLAHLITPAYAVLAGLIGAYLGGIWIWSGNLLVPVAAHAGYDFLALVYLTRIRGRGAP